MAITQEDSLLRSKMLPLAIQSSQTFIPRFLLKQTFPESHSGRRPDFSAMNYSCRREAENKEDTSFNSQQSDLELRPALKLLNGVDP